MKKSSQQVPWLIGAILLLGAALAAIPQERFAVAAQPADAAPGGAAVQSTPATAPATIGTEADEKAIRATADDFVRAFDAGDAKAVGASGRPTPSTRTSRDGPTTVARRSRRNTSTCSRTIAARP